MIKFFGYFDYDFLYISSKWGWLAIPESGDGREIEIACLFWNKPLIIWFLCMTKFLFIFSQILSIPINCGFYLQFERAT
jgi:hypothetical protein